MYVCLCVCVHVCTRVCVCVSEKTVSLTEAVSIFRVRERKKDRTVSYKRMEKKS